MKAWKLLNEEVKGIMNGAGSDAYSLSNIFSTEDYASFKKFKIKSTVKRYIMHIMDSVYLAEPVADNVHGLALLHLLIEDQWIRSTSSLYDHLFPERKFPLPCQIDSLKAIQAQKQHCTDVFKFYKKQNKVFSKSEVGRIYYWQLLLFFHEQDLSRRPFYYELVKQAVNNGALKIENQMNFEIGTRRIQLGIKEFSKQRESIQEEYRKRYSKPNFRIFLI